MAITPDCIEPRLREWLTGLVEESVEESVSRFCFDPFALTEARLHWNGCPACRSDFSGAGGVFERVRLGIEERVEGSLCQFSDEFSACKDSVLSAQQDLGEAYAEILARLVLCGNEVQGALSFAYGEVAQFTVCSELAEQAQREPLSKCAVVICRLEPKVWKFVFESVLCEELFSALFRKLLRMTFPRILTLDSKTREKVFVENDEYLPSNSEEEFIPENLRKALRCIEVKPELLYQIMQSAASNYLHEFANAHGVGAFSAQKVARNGRVLPVQPPWASAVGHAGFVRRSDQDLARHPTSNRNRKPTPLISSETALFVQFHRHPEPRPPDAQTRPIPHPPRTPPAPHPHPQATSFDFKRTAFVRPISQPPRTPPPRSTTPPNPAPPPHPPSPQ